MLKDNLIMLRSTHGYSQEELAEKIGISRQAYAKWESGATVPDIEKCKLLADAYGVSIDSLVKTERIEGCGMLPPAPSLPPVLKKILSHTLRKCKNKTKKAQKALTESHFADTLEKRKAVCICP